jgi:hypothetical protein
MSCRGAQVWSFMDVHETPTIHDRFSALSRRLRMSVSNSFELFVVRESNKISGGERWIRTPGGGVSPYNGLANRRLQKAGDRRAVYPGSYVAVTVTIRLSPGL